MAQKQSDQIVAGLIDRLKSQGYEVRPNAALRGKSGGYHTFDYVVLRRDGFMSLLATVEIINDAEDPETSLHKLFAFQDKCSECDVTRTMVIAIPRLSFVASQFAQKDGVEVFDEQAIQMFLSRPPASQAAPKDVHMAFSQKTEVLQALKTLGYRVDESVRVVGQSGTDQTFAALALWDDGFILSRLGIDIVSGDSIDKGQVTAFDDKCRDAGITEKMLLIPKDLTDEAKGLARQKRIEVVSLDGRRKEPVVDVVEPLPSAAVKGSTQRITPVSPDVNKLPRVTTPVVGTPPIAADIAVQQKPEAPPSEKPSVQLPPVPEPSPALAKATATSVGVDPGAKPAVAAVELPTRARAFSMRSVMDQFLMPQVKPKPPDVSAAPAGSLTGVAAGTAVAQAKIPEAKAVSATEKPPSPQSKAADAKASDIKTPEVEPSGGAPGMAAQQAKTAEAKAVLVAEKPDGAQVKTDAAATEAKAQDGKVVSKTVETAKSPPPIAQKAQAKVIPPAMKVEVSPKQPMARPEVRQGVVGTSAGVKPAKLVVEKPGVEKEQGPGAQAKVPAKAPAPPAPAVEPVVEKPKVKLRKAVRPEALQLVPEATARRFNVLPIGVADGVLEVAMVNASDLSTIQILEMQSKMRVKAVAAEQKEIQDAIDFNYKGFGQIAEQISRVETATDATAGVDLVASTANAPVAAALNLIVEEAVKARASDIHIEPEEKRLRIRYRIDGVLHEVMSLPIKIHPPLTSRVKVMSDLNIADHLRPQDGQFSLEVKGKPIDVRVATSPTVHGETVVMRILDKSMAVMELPQLGFTDDCLEKYMKMLSVPFGMICVSGPTGAGKTTTLYASLNTMDKVTRNIITAEDPVEYRFEGIKQIQVNAKAGLTFAAVLRSMMRLDPDVILVGEIRDAETASIAVKAALTGHTVLCSIHANDACSVVYRLLDLGVEPFMVASVITGTIAQRMARRVCSNCAVETKPTEAEAAAYESAMGEKLESFMSGSGCDLCSFSGYKGRLGLYEVLAMTDTTRALVLKGATTSDLRNQAVKEGMVTLFKDGMQKVKAGKTTVSEVLRNAYSIE